MSTISEEQELDTNNELLVNDSEQLNEIWSNSVKNKKINVFECDVCKRVFTRQLSLNEHKYIHTNCKPFQCLECGKTFRQSSNYQKHQKLHQTENQTNGKTIVCKVCGRHFAQKSYLKSHLLSHNNTKTCLCHKCGNTFKYRCDLIRHMKIHENSRQYKCNICQTGFNDVSSLKRHQRKVHQSQQSIDDNINDCDQVIAKTSVNDLFLNSSDNNNNSLDKINANQSRSSHETDVSVELSSNRMSNDLNDPNYLNSVVDYINVCRILPQPLPWHIFEKVVDLQKEIALHLGIGRKCSTDNFNTLRVGLQDLNAIVFEHLQTNYKINQ